MRKALCVEVAQGFAEDVQRRAHRRPEIRLAFVDGERNETQILVAIFVDQCAVFIPADVGFRERALEQRDQTRIDGDLKLAGVADRGCQIGQDVGEHEFVAQTLLADDEDAFAVERFALPQRRLHQMMHISTETLVETADFVFAGSPP